MESSTKKPLKTGPLKEIFFAKKKEPEKLNKTLLFNQINSSPNQLKPIPIYQNDLIPETIVKRVKGPKPIKLVIPGICEQNNESALKRINEALRDVKEGNRNNTEELLAAAIKKRSHIQDLETLRGNDDITDQLNVVNYQFEMKFVEQLIEKLKESNGRLANAEDKISKVKQELEETQTQLGKTSKKAENYGLQVTKLTELVLELKNKMMQTSNNQTSQNYFSNPAETNNLESVLGLNQNNMENTQKSQEINMQQQFLFSNTQTRESHQPQLFNYSPIKLFPEPQTYIFQKNPVEKH